MKSFVAVVVASLCFPYIRGSLTFRTSWSASPKLPRTTNALLPSPVTKVSARKIIERADRPTAGPQQHEPMLSIDEIISEWINHESDMRRAFTVSTENREWIKQSIIAYWRNRRSDITFHSLPRDLVIDRGPQYPTSYIRIDGDPGLSLSLRSKCVFIRSRAKSFESSEIGIPILLRAGDWNGYAIRLVLANNFLGAAQLERRLPGQHPIENIFDAMRLFMRKCPGCGIGRFTGLDREEYIVTYMKRIPRARV